MKHPTKEELVAYLYEDAPLSPNLQTHLRDCADCRGQLEEWKKVKDNLDSWKVSENASTRRTNVTLLKWAAAAMFMLLIGFGLGRAGTSGIDEARLRADIETNLKSTFAQELNAARESDRKQWIAMLRDIEEQRLADYAALREDLETVAVVADEKLTTTERALKELNLVAASNQSTIE